jgi:hypothetical protein
MPLRLTAPHLILHNFLPATDHAALLAWTLAQESRFTPAGIAGQTIDNSIRRCERLNDLGPFQTLFANLLTSSYTQWLTTLHADPFTQSSIELQIAAYGDGAHFAFHTDTGSGTSHAPTRRMLTAIYYFYSSPKLFTGGDLRLYDLRSRPGPPSDPGTFTTIAPEQNSLLVFPSELGHEVTPSTNPPATSPTSASSSTAGSIAPPDHLPTAKSPPPKQFLHRLNKLPKIDSHLDISFSQHLPNPLIAEFLRTQQTERSKNIFLLSPQKSSPQTPSRSKLLRCVGTTPAARRQTRRPGP